MRRKFFFIIPVAALLLVATTAQGQFEAGNWELKLAGNGANDQDFDGGTVAITGSLGYFTSKEFEVGLRQSLNWSDSVEDTGDSIWSGDTRIFANYHFDMDRWQPYVGVFGGYIYGDVADDSWIGGPEVGVKYFVNSTTFIFAMAQYEFNLEESFSEGGWFYSAGIGFKW